MSLATLIDELNPQQKQAATTDAKHSLVLAGAGCGKTKTIVARAAYLIDQGVPANQIQILTLPVAASEIVARVELALGRRPKVAGIDFPYLLYVSAAPDSQSIWTGAVLDY